MKQILVKTKTGELTPVFIPSNQFDQLFNASTPSLKLSTPKAESTVPITLYSVDIPDEIMLQIFSYLPAYYLCKTCIFVNKNWKRVAEDDKLWYEINKRRNARNPIWSLDKLKHETWKQFFNKKQWIIIKLQRIWEEIEKHVKTDVVLNPPAKFKLKEIQKLPFDIRASWGMFHDGEWRNDVESLGVVGTNRLLMMEEIVYHMKKDLSAFGLEKNFVPLTPLEYGVGDKYCVDIETGKIYAIKGLQLVYCANSWLEFLYMVMDRTL